MISSLTILAGTHTYRHDQAESKCWPEYMWERETEVSGIGADSNVYWFMQGSSGHGVLDGMLFVYQSLTLTNQDQQLPA